MKNILLYILIGFTIASFSQKDDSIESTSQKKKNSNEITTETKNEIRKGNDFYNKGLYTDAERSYKKAIELNPDYDKANYNFGNTQFLQNKIKEAKAQYQSVSKTTKDNFIKADSEHNLGNIAMKEKQYAPAVEAYKNSLRKNPNDDETRYNLAVAQKLLKDQQNKDKNKDKKDDKKKDKKDDKGDKDNKKDDKKEDKKDDKGDKDKDKKGDEDKKDDKKDGKGENKKDDKKQPPKPQPSKLSPDQVKQLLEAMNNEEKKTQKKMNAKKERGRKIKQDKDW